MAKALPRPASATKQLLSIFQELPRSRNRLGCSRAIPAPGWQDLARVGLHWGSRAELPSWPLSSRYNPYCSSASPFSSAIGSP